MRLLLDSHVVVWWLDDHPRLGAAARELIAEADEVFVSVVTPWELGIKRALGRIEFPDDLADSIRAAGFDVLPIGRDHAVIAPALPMHHRDPFDRMLIAQATTDGLKLVSADDALAPYDVTIVDACR